ncbi:hypothetical protein [uncultured Maricaulis sp.]|uniref:hypothetical protein n=1 Tax=uncultured Maricaulis sp. TaxID=174710 RepID=UPI0030D929CC|tara:strand:- start:129514 stop:130062 length:549 start_codon:yes stop_codon:yes gene_type:complete
MTEDMAKPFWSEVVAHFCAIALTVTLTTLAMRLYPDFRLSLVGPMALSIVLLALSLPVFRHFTRKRLNLPPITAHWFYLIGSARFASIEMADALPAWQVFWGRYHGPGIGRVLGFLYSLIGTGIVVFILTPAFHLPLAILLPALIFFIFWIAFTALISNRLPQRKPETFSRMESGRRSRPRD